MSVPFVDVTWSEMSVLRAGMWREDDNLPRGGASFHLGVGLPDLIQLVDVRDRDDRVPRGNCVEEVLQDAGRQIGGFPGVGGEPDTARDVVDRVEVVNGPFV